MRQNIMPNTSLKLMEAYMDFSGGLNSEVGNERLKDNEFPVLENVDLMARASARRRYGRQELIMQYPYDLANSTAQGMFAFYRPNFISPDIIAAVSGRLYVKTAYSGPEPAWNVFSDKTWAALRGPAWTDFLNNLSVMQEIPITDLNGNPFTFQKYLPIEAVQWRDSLFVATGTKLVEVTWDSDTASFKASIVNPYKPTSQEVMNIGVNAIADNPASWITDIGSTNISIDSITSVPPIPVVNQPCTFTAHIEKPDNVQLNYSWSYRKTGAGNFQSAGTFSENNATITFPDTGAYDIQVQTSKVTNNIATWDTSNEGWHNVIQGNQWDGDGVGTGILQGSEVCAEDSTLQAWKDFSTPLDLTNSDTIDWLWTSYSQDSQNGDNANTAFQLKFYTAGNLSTPVLTVGNPGGETGRGIGGGYDWNHPKVTYDNTKAGLANIVRVGIAGSVVNKNGNYVANQGTYSIASNDSTTRVDNITCYLSNSATSYIKNSVQVSGVMKPANDPTTYAQIHTSRMIRVWYDQIILACDANISSQWYVSDVANPRYFPQTSYHDFSPERKEPITSIVKYRDMLIVFTKTTITACTGGTSVSAGLGPFTFTMIHDNLGCVAGRTARVINNDLLFLSGQGFYRIRPNQFIVTAVTVERADMNLKSEVAALVNDENACADVSDGMYFVNFPSIKTGYRFYIDQGVWVRDTSTEGGKSPLEFNQILDIDNLCYNLSVNGRLYIHDKTVYTDCGDVFTMVVESKMYDLESSFNYKKLRRLHVLGKHFPDHDVQYAVTVTADSTITLTPEVGEAVIADGYTTWQVTTVPNVNFNTGARIDDWKLGAAQIGDIKLSNQKAAIRGKCRRVTVRFEHTDTNPCELYGYGFEFKMKRP